MAVYVVVGQEQVLVDRVVGAVRVAAMAPELADFNVELFQAAEIDVDRVLEAARTVPMMAPRRLVIVRGVERWEPAAASKEAPAKAAGSGESLQPRKTSKVAATRVPGAKAAPVSAMDKLVVYLQAPVASTCLVLCATKLDKRRKFMSTATKAGFAVNCDPVSARALPRFVTQEIQQRGHDIRPELAQLIADMTGPSLADVLDAIERLSLYVGAQNPIDSAAISACVTPLRSETVWKLVDAVGQRDTATALAVVDDVYEPQDRGLRLVGLLAWSTRQLLRFALAQRQGASVEQAAAEAGVAPFKAREIAAQVRALHPAQLEHWLAVLAQTDRALKSSRRSPRVTIETAIIELTRSGVEP